MKKQFLHGIPSILAAGFAMFWLSGCATNVTVRTNPPDGAVYARGSGRPAYRWEFKGISKADKPARFDMYYSAMDVFVQWPDGVRSEIRHQDMHFSSKPVLLDFTRPGTPGAARKTK